MVNDEINAIEKRRAENTPAEMFDELRLLSLRMARHILTLPNALADFDGDSDKQHKRLTLQARMSESVIADSIKIDEAALRHSERQSTLELIRDKLAAVVVPERED